MDKLEFEKISEKTFKEFKITLKEMEVLDLESEKVIEQVYSEEVVRKFMKFPVKFKFNTDGEMYVEYGSEKFFFDPREEDKAQRGKNLDKCIENLPPCPFDLFCGGVQRKQREVIAAYKTIIVNKLVDDAYKEDIAAVLNGYDFKEYRNSDENKSFTNLLEVIQEDATPVIKLCLTSMSMLIASMKVKNDQAHIGILSAEDSAELEEVAKEITGINAKAQKALESMEERIDRLKHLELVKDEINKYLSEKGRRITVLYRIYTLTTDSLPSKTVAKVKQAARKKVNDLINAGELLDLDFKKKLVDSIVGKALRIELNVLKKAKYKKFSDVNDNNFENILPKT